jgi:hypothetical protein
MSGLHTRYTMHSQVGRLKQQCSFHCSRPAFHAPQRKPGVFEGRRDVVCSSAAAWSWGEPIDQLAQAIHSLYKFSRPHTMLGTAISVISVSVAAMLNVGWVRFLELDPLPNACRRRRKTVATKGLH